MTRLSRHTIVDPPVDYPVRTRFVRDNPGLREIVRASDMAANQLRRQSLEPSRLERVTTWAAVGLAVGVSLYFAAQFLRLAL